MNERLRRRVRTLFEQCDRTVKSTGTVESQSTIERFRTTPTPPWKDMTEQVEGIPNSTLPMSHL
eukprot:765826-Hanusia_phi.AAC.6